MLKSVLIANRGEVACRILRTSQRLGIRTCVVYSEADKDSLAVELAEEAYFIGPSPASQSYLNQEAILKAAHEANVEAIHPGYGFLSENAAFAQACEKAGLTFIGPSVACLQKMGSKSEAKAIARREGIPVIPGFEGGQESLSKEADLLGFPLMIKAVMGGGGKGMRLVTAREDFQASLESCQREALSSFGNGDVLLEKYIPEPRHIEVQIFGDKHGNYVHLFERDCSLQRRHQKVIEEAPSSLPADLKEKIFESALRLVKTIQYEGAGTVEFLVDKDSHFYFMEMNTRLQVEHPITEEITGLDLVEWQIRVASQGKLPLSQKDIKVTGHALELRLYAEDPEQDFKPMTGQIWMRELPKEARIETGLHPFDHVTSYYDPLLAKLIVKGNSRHDALQKAQMALNQWTILGLTTNASFLKRLLESPSVQENKVDIGFIDRKEKTLTSREPTPDFVLFAASLISLLAESSLPESPWEEPYHWHMEGYHPLSFEWACGDEVRSYILTYSREGWKGEQIGPFPIEIKDNTLIVSQFHIPFWKRENHISLFFEGETYNLTPHTPMLTTSHHHKQDSLLKAPLTGKVSLILVSEGDEVKENQPLLILEAMKMEHMIASPCKGRIKRIFYSIDDIVEEGSIVIDLDDEKEAS